MPTESLPSSDIASVEQMYEAVAHLRDAAHRFLDSRSAPWEVVRRDTVSPERSRKAELTLADTQLVVRESEAWLKGTYEGRTAVITAQSADTHSMVSLGDRFVRWSQGTEGDLKPIVDVAQDPASAEPSFVPHFSGTANPNDVRLRLLKLQEWLDDAAKEGNHAVGYRIAGIVDGIALKLRSLFPKRRRRR